MIQVKEFYNMINPIEKCNMFLKENADKIEVIDIKYIGSRNQYDDFLTGCLVIYKELPVDLSKKLITSDDILGKDD